MKKGLCLAYQQGGILESQVGGLVAGTLIVAIVIDPDTTRNTGVQNDKQVGFLFVSISKEGKTFRISTNGKDAEGRPAEGPWVFGKE